MKIYKVNCEKCSRFLCEAPAGSETLCPGCGSWTKTKPEEKTRPNQARQEAASNGSI